MGVCLQPLAEGPTIRVDKPILFVGRDPECDIVLTDSRRISRKHCCLAHVNDRLIIRDLGSMNGVWINGVRVESSGAIAIGDEFAIGDVRFRLVNLDKEGTAVPEIPPAAVNEESHDVPVMVDESPGEPPLQDAEAASAEGLPVEHPLSPPTPPTTPPPHPSPSSLPELPADQDSPAGNIIPLVDDDNYYGSDSDVIPYPG